MIIRKKAWPELFEKVLSGEKQFDLRLADFKISKSDILVLEEWDPVIKKYTGRKIEKKVSYVLRTKDLEFWPEEKIKKYGYQVIQLEDWRLMKKKFSLDKYKHISFDLEDYSIAKIHSLDELVS